MGNRAVCEALKSLSYDCTAHPIPCCTISCWPRPIRCEDLS
ncbi:hypothetical protein [Edaphobacter lichenicola]